MSCILYARVSSGEQAEKDLSIPAQLRALRQTAQENNWPVVAEYSDIKSGTSLRERAGLLSAVRHALKDRHIKALLVYKVDRLCRNMYEYLTIKGRLRLHGKRIVSVVERFESSPVGEFVEHIMAAQAEYHSANMGTEIKKSLYERLKRGKWISSIPIGYRKVGNRLVLDSARATHVCFAFEQWSTGKVTVPWLNAELARRGFVGQRGKLFSHNGLYRVLKNPFYAGILEVKSKRYPGIHPALIGEELFNQCQKVFQGKHKGGVQRSRRHFLLAGKLLCPRCGRFMIGEHHAKPSGRIFRYYRCHGPLPSCGKIYKAQWMDDEVMRHLRGMAIAGDLRRVLRRLAKTVRYQSNQVHGKRLRLLRASRRALDKRVVDLEMEMVRGNSSYNYYTGQRREVAEEARAIEFMLQQEDNAKRVTPNRFSRLHKIITNLDAWLASKDPYQHRQAIEALISTISVRTDKPKLTFLSEWEEAFGLAKEYWREEYRRRRERRSTSTKSDTA